MTAQRSLFMPQTRRKLEDMREALVNDLRYERKRLFDLLDRVDNAERFAARELDLKLKELSQKIEDAETLAQSELACFRDQLAFEREKLRKSLAAELLSAKRRLKILQEAEERASAAWARRAGPLQSMSAGAFYPDVPPPLFKPHVEGVGLPTAPGVYFLWANDVVEYVGQSVKISQRVRLGLHKKLSEAHMISFLFFDEDVLNWAESFYIGILRPRLNFGKSSRAICHDVGGAPTALFA